MDAYFIIGLPDSGRRAVVLDLISRGLDGDTHAAVMLAASEKSAEADLKLAALSRLEKYESYDEAISKVRALDGVADVCFFIANSNANIADSIEALKAMADSNIFRLVRIFGVIDCEFFTQNFDKAAVYYDALSHFSDCLFLAKRLGLEGKAVSAIKKRYEQMYRPHIYQLVLKDGKVESPIEALIDETRRISMLFDDYDPIDELELDEDTLPTEPFDISKKPDPYLERNDQGQRLLPIPNSDELKKLSD